MSCRHNTWPVCHVLCRHHSSRGGKMVTFRVSDKSPEIIRYEHEQDQNYLASLPEYQEEKCAAILRGTTLNNQTFHPKSSGFVHGVTDAYNRHHNLVIRPDDVWMAIAVQFGLYVNANSESLRSLFVDHQGKKELTVSAAGDLNSVDYGRLATKMTTLLHDNVKDKELCNWILPSFSTTTKNDVVVGSVVLMATLKSYFSYRFELLCGIPYVTLLGTSEDWEEIHNRVDRLCMYGEECEKWSVMLKEVTGKLLESSKGNIDVEFWSRVCHYVGGGSGPTYLSGWISVFCVFDKDGKWQGECVRRGGEMFWSGAEESETEGKRVWPHVNTKDIPPGYVTVDVVVSDNGKEHETLMFAGHMGYEAVEDGKSIAPKVTWAITLKGKPSKAVGEL